MAVTHKIDHQNKTLTIYVNGQFNFSAHPQFRNSYAEIKDKPYTATVDLRDAESMDSAALGMLLLLEEDFPAAKVKITNTNNFVRQVLEIAHFSKKFDIS